MPWVILKFVETNEIEVIPEKWYVPEKKFVYYPSCFKESRNIQKAIKCQYEVDKSSWSRYEVENVKNKVYDNFQVACSKATKACHNSELSETEPELSMKRFRKKKIFTSSDESSEDEPDLIVPKPPQTTNKKHVLTDIPNESIANLPITTDVDEETLETLNGRDKDGHTSFEKQVIGLLVKQRKRLIDQEDILRNIEKKMELILNNTSEPQMNITATPKERIFAKLPISEFTEFTEIQQTLEEQSTYDDLVTDLQKIGGTNYKECTRRILKKIFCDQLAAQFSVHGHKGKFQFYQTRLLESLTAAVIKQHPIITNKEVELVVGTWLAKAPIRQKGKEPDGVANLEVANLELQLV